MGKEQLLNMKIRVYIKGRSLLGIEPVAPHREVTKIKTGYERLKDAVRKGHTATVDIITS